VKVTLGNKESPKGVVIPVDLGLFPSHIRGPHKNAITQYQLAHPELFRYFKDSASRLEKSIPEPARKRTAKQQKEHTKELKNQRTKIENQVKAEGVASSSDFLLWLVWCHLVTTYCLLMNANSVLATRGCCFIQTAL
jgi:hypothetical protein